jgi:DNA-binding winged helix-turn-helix (wHTH) protein
MPEAQEWHCGPWRLDLANERLWHGAEAVRLRPKSFAVLRYLVERPGQLVTKEELLQAVWPEVEVGEAVLAVSVSELRRVLQDPVQAPQFIATVPRRGYRFLAPSRHTAPLPRTPAGEAPQAARRPLVVGRAAEVAQLQGWLQAALGGQRQVVFVSGELGIGKTTVVEAFLASGAAAASWQIRGQCLAHYGTGEAYLPVLDALAGLCRGPRGATLVPLLRRYAPTWLVQVPGLLSAADVEALQRTVHGSTRERMLRELAGALEALAAAHPVVLVLEDLHWSDYATLDLVAFLAQRRDPARLLVLGTYRPVEVIVRGHPLKAVVQDLGLRRHCVELRLDGLGATAVAAYLAMRFPQAPWPPGLETVLHRRTDGHPLFLVTVTDWWVQQGRVAQVEGHWHVPDRVEALAGAVPDSLRTLIESQLEELSTAAQALLEAASVVGEAFSAAAVAAAVEAPVAEVEQQCAALVRRGRLARWDRGGVLPLPACLASAGPV